MECYKRYIEIVALHDKYGSLTPLFLYWEDSDGRKKFKIDKIISKKESFSVVGGCGICYCCLIQGNQRKIYLEKGNRWFIESLKP